MWTPVGAGEDERESGVLVRAMGSGRRSSRRACGCGCGCGCVRAGIGMELGLLSCGGREGVEKERLWVGDEKKIGMGRSARRPTNPLKVSPLPPSYGCIT